MNKREVVIRNCFNSWLNQDLSMFLACFSDDIHYIESYGPAYQGKKQIESWFLDWNKSGQVLVWDIKQLLSIDNTIVCEWYFKCDVKGVIADFDGISIIEFNQDDKIVYLKEFKSDIPNRYPYG